MKLFDRTIKAIIFDHDGTLVDSESTHCECWNQVLSQFGQQLSLSDYCQDYNGLPTLETARRLQQKLLMPTTPQTLYDAKIIVLKKHLRLHPFPLLPNVRTALNILKDLGIPMAIASGANRGEVKHSVQAHQLQSFFTYISTKDDVINSKPAPDVYLHAAKHLGIPPAHCLAVEDSDTGEQSANAAGMLCIRLTGSAQNPGDHHLQFRDMGGVLSLIRNQLSTGKNSRID